MRLSFCITCKGRLNYLKQTLPLNLLVCHSFESEVELVLLDYNSSDGLLEWLPKDPLLKCFSSSKPHYFNMSHAKNVVHRLAKGAFLCNLDADNVLTIEFVEKLLSLKSDEITYGKGGASGRICIASDIFYALGGYDEEFQGWGMDDKDLVLRAEKGFGLKLIEITPLAPYIEHPQKIRESYFVNKDFKGSWEFNKNRHLKNMKERRYVANQGKDWGRLDVKDFFVHDL